MGEIEKCVDRHSMILLLRNDEDRKLERGSQVKSERIKDVVSN